MPSACAASDRRTTHVRRRRVGRRLCCRGDRERTCYFGNLSGRADGERRGRISACRCSFPVLPSDSVWPHRRSPSTCPEKLLKIAVDVSALGDTERTSSADARMPTRMGVRWDMHQRYPAKRHSINTVLSSSIYNVYDNVYSYLYM